MLFPVSKPSSETDPSIHIEQNLEVVAERRQSSSTQTRLDCFVAWSGPQGVGINGRETVPELGSAPHDQLPA